MRLKHKKIVKAAKGFRGRGKNCFRVAVQRVERSWEHAYRGRKEKRREFRKLWITRINAGVREHGYSYSRFIKDMKDGGIALDRKVLAEVAGTEPHSFRALVETIKVLSGKPSPARVL